MLQKLKKYTAFMAALLIYSGPGLAAESVNLERFLQSAASASAIAAAVAMVDGCSLPLEIEESQISGGVRLSFSCNGNEEEEGTAIIEFMDDGAGGVLPLRYDFAG